MNTFTLPRYFGKLLCLSTILSIFVLETIAQTTNGRAYNLVYSSNLKGGHIAFGNTSMAIYQSNNTTIDVAKMNAFNLLANGQTNPNTNNSANMRFVDVDGDASTTNSSTADLVLPVGTNSIKFARLYWGAKITAGLGANANINLRKIKIRKGTSGAYTDFTAPTTQIDKLLAEGTDTAYTSYLDITSFIQANSAGTYTVANITGRTGSTTQGCFAGWTIVVVYENATQPYSSMRVYDGFQDVGGNNGNSFTSTLTGFNAPATPLTAADAYMTTMAWEGDAVPISNSVSDYLLVNGDTVKNAINPGNNFWNSSISNNGAFVTTKSPDYKTQMGIDLDRVDVGVGYGITSNATSVTVKFGTSGDHYYATMFAFTMTTKDPTITIAKSVSDSAAPFNSLTPGEALTYTLTGSNTGVGAANSVVIVDTLPSNLTYIPGSLVVVASPGITVGAKTDAAGDDVAFVGTNAGKTYIKFYIGTGATSSAGGTLLSGETYTVTFRARVTSNINLLSAVSNTARITGQALSGDAFVDESTIIINPPSGGPLPVVVAGFTAIEENGNVQLDLAIATEINVKYYEAQFSMDGRNFSSAGTITAANKNEYSFVHVSPEQGYNYYRIKIVNNDGSAQYTTIHSIKLTKNTNVSVYPNPAISQLNVAIPQALINKRVTVKMYNNIGQLMLTNEYKHAQQVERVSLAAMASGVYNMQIILPDNTQLTKRIQVIRK